MADETKDETTATLDQASEESAEQNLPTELPDDPVEKAAALEARLAETTKETRRLKADKERLEESNRELEGAKKTWYNRYTEAESRLNAADQQPKAGKGKETRASKLLFGEDGKPKELADLVAEGATLKDIVEDIYAGVDQKIEQRVNKETTKGNAFRGLVERNPELIDQNHPLTKAAADIYTNMQRERPDLDDADRWEIAVARAARQIDYVPSKAKSNGDDAVERERRRNGQGGPTGTSNARKGAVVIDDAYRAMAKKMNGGVPVPDKDLIAGRKRWQEEQARQSARA